MVSRLRGNDSSGVGGQFRKLTDLCGCVFRKRATSYIVIQCRQSGDIHNPAQTVVEKAFGNLKERLNARRMLVSSEQSLDGKLFVEFVSLISIYYIKKQMQESDLFKSYSRQQMPDKLDVIACFAVPGKQLQIGEILEKQKLIYDALGVELPTSL